MNFLLDEDEALRDRLLGMTVSDNKNPTRPVGVWFGQPDPEIRSQNYPFLTVDLIDISEATERVMSGKIDPWYFEPDIDPQTQGWSMYYPTPINLDYQVTTFARQPRHDRQIVSQLLGARLPLRFGSLVVKAREKSDGSYDGTVRRLDLLNVVKRDMTEAGKRLFMNSFTVRVSSEIPQPYEFQTYYKALEVRLSTGAIFDQVLDPVTEIEITAPTLPGSP
ncbi:MAG: hypothetical protein WAO78_14930 [Roseovarius sp.]